MTVTEVLPKEKKQKEEKTQNLGQCSIDLLPLVRGIAAILYIENYYYNTINCFIFVSTNFRQIQINDHFVST